MRPWGGFEVAVEVRPAPPRPGHNEVVVIITAERHRPVYDALVWMRARPDAPWVQAIEDGHVGVYRRAINFGRAGATQLEVKLQRESSVDVLVFPATVMGAGG